MTHYLLLVSEQEFSLNLSFFLWAIKSNQAGKKHHGHFILWTRKNLIYFKFRMSPLCAFSITASLDRRSRQMDGGWLRVGADDGKLRRTFFQTLLLKLNAFLFFSLIKSLLKWLALDWAIVQRCGAEGCEHTTLKPDTVQVFCPPRAQICCTRVWRNNGSHVSTAFVCWIREQTDGSAGWHRSVKLNPCYCQIREAPLSPLHWNRKYFLFG